MARSKAAKKSPSKKFEEEEDDDEATRIRKSRETAIGRALQAQRVHLRKQLAAKLREEAERRMSYEKAAAKRAEIREAVRQSGFGRLGPSDPQERAAAAEWSVMRREERQEEAREERAKRAATALAKQRQLKRLENFHREDVAEAVAQRHEELSQIRAANVVKRKQRAVRKKREKQKALEMEKQAVIEKELAAERKKIAAKQKEERTANKAARQLLWEMVAPASGAAPRRWVEGRSLSRGARFARPQRRKRSGVRVDCGRSDQGGADSLVWLWRHYSPRAYADTRRAGWRRSAGAWRLACRGGLEPDGH